MLTQLQHPAASCCAAAADLVLSEALPTAQVCVTASVTAFVTASVTAAAAIIHHRDILHHVCAQCSAGSGGSAACRITNASTCTIMSCASVSWLAEQAVDSARILHSAILAIQLESEALCKQRQQHVQHPRSC
jgi:hypothetical protein